MMINYCCARLLRFTITKNKHRFDTTPGREYLLRVMVRIEDNTEVGRNLTCDKITDLLSPSAQSIPAPIQDPIAKGGLDEDDLSLENLSVGEHPPKEHEKATTTSMDIPSPRKKGVKRNTITNLVDT